MRIMTTKDGFEYVECTDSTLGPRMLRVARQGREFTQDSEQRPIAAHLWIGDPTDTARLSRAEVAELVAYLQNWLEHGSFLGRAT